MSRRAAWTLIALCIWTLWVWITRLSIVFGQNQSVGFKVVHTILAIGSIAFGLAAGWIGLRSLRSSRQSPGEIEHREAGVPR